MIDRIIKLFLLFRIFGWRDAIKILRSRMTLDDLKKLKRRLR